MKKGKLIYIFILLLVLAGCSKKKEIAEIMPENEVYVVEEKVFDADISDSNSIADWVVGTVLYSVAEGALFRYDVISGKIVQTPLDLGDLQPMRRIRYYTDANDVIHILCKCLDQESGKYDAYICCFDPNGALISKYLCTDVMKKAFATALYVEIMPTGESLFFFNEDGKIHQMLVSETGQILYDEEKEDKVVDFKYREDGDLIIYTEKEGLFTTTLKDGRWNQLDSDFVDNEFERFLEGPDEPDAFYYRTMEDIRKYDVKSKKIQIVLKFEDLSMNPRNVGWIMRAEEGEFYILSGPTFDTFNFYKVRKAMDGESVAISQKKELTLAFVGFEGMYDKEVYAFNESQNDIRIRMQVYDDIDNLLAEIIAGNIPDLIDISDATIYKAMMEKNLLEDLHPFFAKDTDLSEDDFMDNALEYYNENGRLYAIPYALEMYSMMGRSDFLGERSTWNLPEFEEFIDSLPQADIATEGITRNELFYYLCMLYFDRFVDEKNGKCSFQTEEFYQLLKCCKRFAVMDEDSYDEEEAERMLVDGECILTVAGITGVNFDYAMTRSLFQKKAKLIGFPTESGSGDIVIAFPLVLAITTQGENGEYAWEFVKFLMTQERENLDYMDFVSYKPLYEKHMSMLREEAESGKAITSISLGNQTLDIAPATSDEIEELGERLNKGMILKPYDYKILDIIDEEADAYFCGEKNEEQVAEIIQKRVKLYLAE